ncbi:hypothetical protein C1I38_02420 [Dehalobacter sp. 12DCB1]|uniref:cell wall-binding repeat-containing protein n=1 Tax=Dehalobacter sp. 12DCB1 TaxID=2070364 RepID=UPI0010470415|nr:cell wall-binding repeat-containing protein [Dehalobacter sp. 12DCB1]TCX56384.1 hypothetical protein C1I38_02420 [Dehalobacter sp. 12DCB1]
MSRTKKIAVLAIIAMVLTLMPAALFAATADSTRLSGADRIGTALDIASAGTWGTSVVLAPADQANLVDALAAAPLAGQENAPILLTFKGSLDAAVKAKIAALGATKVYVVGAISADVAAEVDAMTGVTVETLKGDGRQATAAAVNAKLTSPAGTFVVGYDAIADALSVASYAAKNKFAIVLANQDGSVASASLVGATKYIIGGTAKVDDITGVARISGADRFATNSAVASTLNFDYARVYVANGVNCVDALSVAPLAAKYSSFVALSSSNDVAAAAVVNGKLLSTSKVIAVGGTSSVPDTVVAKVSYANTTLAVVSATAINASQVQVVFNKAVTKLSAESVANYTVNGTAFAASAVFGGVGSIAKLSTDGKTVTLEARTTFLANNTSFELKITGITDTDYKAIAPAYKTVTGNDVTAPSIDSVTSSAGTAGTKNVVVTLSEPVFLGTPGAYKINGVNAVATIDAVFKNKVNLVAASTLAAGSSNTLTVSGLSDGINAAAQLTQTFTVTSDTAAPKVASVTQAGGTLKVVFDKEISNTNFTALTLGVNSVSDISLSKQGDATAYITTAPALDAMDLTNKTVVLTVGGTIYGSASTTTAVLTLKNIEDVNGNKMEAYSSSITLTKDVVKPTLVSSVLDASDNTTIYLTFSEEVTDPNFAGTITVIDKSTATDVSGAKSTPVTEIITKSDWTAVPGGITLSKYVKLSLEAALVAGKSYTITLPGLTVTDAALNKMDSVSFEVTAATASDAVKPVPSKGVSAIAVVSGKNVIDVSWSENVQLADAINTANYVLNGSALPAGTVITNTSGTAGDTNRFSITLPAAGVTADAAVADLLITGIKDIAGNATLPTTLSAWNAGLDLVDTKKPTVVSAKATANNKLEITFSEPVNIVTLGAATNEIRLTDDNDATSKTFNAGVDTVAYLGNTATLTFAAGQVFGGLNWTAGAVELVIDAGAVVDRSAGALAIDAVAATHNIAVTDKFVDVVGGSVLVTDGVVSDDETFAEINVAITAPTNTLKDRIVKYEVYIAPASVADYTTVANVELYLSKLATILPAANGAVAAQDLTAAAGNFLSDGTTLVATLAGVDLDIYVVAIDEAGNKALISDVTTVEAINVAD